MYVFCVCIIRHSEADVCLQDREVLFRICHHRSLQSDIFLIILTVFYMLRNFLAEYLMLHVTL